MINEKAVIPGIDPETIDYKETKKTKKGDDKKEQAKEEKTKRR